jgi:predicted transposase/invertase (TIGR01784 family)
MNEDNSIFLSMREKDLQRLATFRLMDDDFFSEALDRKTEAVRYVLNTILHRNDLQIIYTKAQVEYKSAIKRSIKIDIKAIDSDRKVYDIEIQRSDHGVGAKRARYHSSMIDRDLLGKGDDFNDLVESYVIFITEEDKFKKGLPLYHIERKITELDNALFGDGAHIIYVNGEFQDTGHPIGRLMHDFHCSDAKDILNPILAQEVVYLKETEGGRNHMCRILEEMREEAAQIAREEGRELAIVSAIQNMMSDLMLSADQAMSVMRIPEEERSRYLKKVSGC